MPNLLENIMFSLFIFLFQRILKIKLRNFKNNPLG